MPSDSPPPKWLIVLAALAILSGVFFRLYNIDHKVFWFDETITSHIISGHTNWELEDAIKGRIISPSGLESRYAIAPGTGLGDAYGVAVREDLHPPLYYCLTWLWVSFWNPQPEGTPAAIRYMSSAISLLSMPLMYALAAELFRSKRTALIAVALFALSPFHVLYAQEARVYSLWTFAILLANLLFIRAAREGGPARWAAYAASMVFCLWMHIFSAFILFGHGLYVLLAEGLRGKSLGGYSIAAAVAVISFAPWLKYLAENPGLTAGVNSWTGSRKDAITMVALWGRGVSSVFFDADVSLSNLAYTFLPAAAAVLFAAYVLKRFVRTAPSDARLFVLAMMAANVLSLLIPDVVLGGWRSGVPRYLLSAYIGLQLCVAHFFGSGLTGASASARKHWLVPAAFAVLLFTGLISCALSSQAEVWWNKYLTVDFPQIRQTLSASEQPVLISEENPAILYSLTRGLGGNVSVLFIEEPRIVWMPAGYSDIFLYHPSERLRQSLGAGYSMEPVPGCEGLWRIKPKP
jgi:uncharacterized membrane protein